MGKYKTVIKNLFEETDITLNGKKPWDIQVHNDKFYKKVFTTGSLGLGESYMQGWWNCEKPDEFLYRVISAGIDKKVKESSRLSLMYLKATILNPQTENRSFKAISKHYNAGNDLYAKMLDPLMNYSCGYWEKADNLVQAQEDKLELICQKLQLKSGEKVLDIGCGWGGFAFYAAKNFGVEVVGITISTEQQEFASKRCKGLPIEIRLQDYRKIDETFDKIVSIGMVEHVGPKNYDAYLDVINTNLKDDGLCLLHFIGGNESTDTTDPWIDKYIFPGGVIPSIAQIGKSLENKFVLQDWHNFGKDYDLTLLAWYSNFKKSWPLLQENYTTEFYKMWEFYLCSCAASFRSNDLNLWQLVLTKKTYPHTYRSVRPSSMALT